MADYLEREVSRKRKSRENETPDQHAKCQARDRENKIKNKAKETPEKRKERLDRERKQKQQRRVLNKKVTNESLNHQRFFSIMDCPIE